MMKTIVKYLIKKFGYEINKSNKNYFGLKKFNFDLIFDVGANNGDSSRNFLVNFPNAKIFAFEPNEAHEESLKTLSKSSGGRFSYCMCGVGSQSGSEKFWVHKKHDASSSFLKLSTEGMVALNHFTKIDLSDQDAKFSKIITLDDFFSGVDYKNKKILLKSDTQGFEMEVLKGAEGVINYLTAIQIELDFFKFYDQQACAEEIISYLYSRNFSLKGFTYPPGVNEYGEPLSSDFIFYNNRIWN